MKIFAILALLISIKAFCAEPLRIIPNHFKATTSAPLKEYLHFDLFGGKQYNPQFRVRFEVGPPTQVRSRVFNFYFEDYVVFREGDDLYLVNNQERIHLAKLKGFWIFSEWKLDPQFKLVVQKEQRGRYLHYFVSVEHL